MSPDMQKLVERQAHELGFRMTPQRKIILEAIEEAGEHATVEEIYDQVQSTAPDISQATVYRTLDVFSRYRLIHGNEIAGGSVYEVVSQDPHHHLMCHNCWKDQKIKEEAIRPFYKRVEEEFGFLVLAEHFVFMGLCADCRKELGDRLGRFSPHPKFQTKD